MANLCECALAIKKDCLKGGVSRYIRRAKPDDTNEKVTKYTVYKNNEWFGEPARYVDAFCIQHGDKYRFIIRDEGRVVYTTREESDFARVYKRCEDKLKTMDYDYMGDDHITKNTFVDKGWCVDWKALGRWSGSYDYTPYIKEYDDHITLFFGAPWNFPDEIVNILERRHAEWEGAGVEDGSNYRNYFGNATLGLKIASEDSGELDEDGKPLLRHYIVDTSE